MQTPMQERVQARSQAREQAQERVQEQQGAAAAKVLSVRDIVSYADGKVLDGAFQGVVQSVGELKEGVSSRSGKRYRFQEFVICDENGPEQAVVVFNEWPEDLSRVFRVGDVVRVSGSGGSGSGVMRVYTDAYKKMRKVSVVNGAHVERVGSKGVGVSSKVLEMDVDGAVQAIAGIYLKLRELLPNVSDEVVGSLSATVFIQAARSGMSVVFPRGAGEG